MESDISFSLNKKIIIFFIKTNLYSSAAAADNIHILRQQRIAIDSITISIDGCGLHSISGSHVLTAGTYRESHHESVTLHHDSVSSVRSHSLIINIHNKKIIIFSKHIESDSTKHSHYPTLSSRIQILHHQNSDRTPFISERNSYVI